MQFAITPSPFPGAPSPTVGSAPPAPPTSIPPWCPTHFGSRSESPFCPTAPRVGRFPAVTLGKPFSPHVILQIINGPAAALGGGRISLWGTCNPMLTPQFAKGMALIHEGFSAHLLGISVISFAPAEGCAAAFKIIPSWEKETSMGKRTPGKDERRAHVG